MKCGMRNVKSEIFRDPHSAANPAFRVPFLTALGVPAYLALLTSHQSLLTALFFAAWP
jgi:hypothetical protein